MIEHKFFYLDKFKDIADAARELDKLMMYEGFVYLGTVGRKNNVLLLRRILEEPQQQEFSPPTSNKSQAKKKGVMYPNAIHR